MVYPTALANTQKQHQHRLPPIWDREGTGDQNCVAAPVDSAWVSEALDTTITICFFNVKSKCFKGNG